MLQLVIPGGESFNDATGEFIQRKSQKLQLEHSLVSVSKWEAKWKIPFLTDKKKTIPQTVDYIRCMTLTQNVSPDVYSGLTSNELEIVQKYIDDTMTATTFNFRDNRRGGKDVITSEVIYYWMVFFGIPFECQKWHLNRLLTLIQVCNVKQGGSGKKRSMKQILNENRDLNAARRAAMNSKG